MKLTEKVHLLTIDFEITPGQGRVLPRFVNVIMILGERVTLVDTGVKGSEEKIAKYLLQNGRNISEIGTVILSHSHPDHIGAAAEIKSITGCRILAHKKELPWIEDIQLQNNERPVPGFFNLVSHPVKVDDLIENGQELKASSDVTLGITDSPGHSKGSVNILFREDQILFTADSIPLKNDIPNYDNYTDLLRSIDAIKSNNNYRTLLTSWTPPLYSRAEIDELIRSGKDYVLNIDRAVREVYVGAEPEPLMFCRKTIEKLGLPPYFVNPLADRAFRSHQPV